MCPQRNELSLPDRTGSKHVPFVFANLGELSAELDVEQRARARSHCCHWRWWESSQRHEIMEGNEQTWRGHLSNLRHGNYDTFEVLHTFSHQPPKRTVYHPGYTLTGRDTQQWGNGTTPQAALLASPDHVLTVTAKQPLSTWGEIIILVVVTVPVCVSAGLW